MTDTRILIVVKDEEAGQAYAAALNDIGVAYDLAPCVDKMSGMATVTPYSGLIIDLLTLVRCSREEKVVAYELINLYPVLRVKWNSRKKEICLSPLEQSFSPDTATTLRFFIDSRCRPFPPRRLRSQNRKNYNLHVLLTVDGTDVDEIPTRTFTLNISRGGVFVHTCRSFAKGDAVSLRFVEFPDLPPFAATVRWSVPWGGSRSVPGVGLRFDTLTEEQQKMLAAIAD